ncbi:hypothetical protein M885DRAFT_511204 [Pelagophyceae sp. CCMP2097]|nr:hypothetical protein M885DRAFT_511204 [Pelagophyceae sp. CCMP2097]
MALARAGPPARTAGGTVVGRRRSPIAIGTFELYPGAFGKRSSKAPMERALQRTAELLADGVLTQEEHDDTVAEIRAQHGPPKRARTKAPTTDDAASESALAKTAALLADGILTQEEHDAKAAEIRAAAGGNAASRGAAASGGGGAAAAKKRKAAPAPAADDWELLGAAELKRLCKAAGVSGGGDKGTLVWRLKLDSACKAEQLALDGLDDVRSPFSLKAAELKKLAAKQGVSVMGSTEEIIELLVKALREKKRASGGGETRDTKTCAIDLARKVLDLSEGGDDEAVLSLGSAEPLDASDVAALQQAYRKLARAIHPDKLRGFDGATRAFQALVTALERLTRPEIGDSAKGARDASGSAAKTILRTNDGCKRTRLRCPRCDEPWGESKSEGNPDWSYNLMMTGLRTFNCSTCLCEFGCCTAKHECKKCGQAYEYSAGDYHNKVECSKCSDTFGFWEYHISDRARKDALGQAREASLKLAGARASRQRRATKKVTGNDDGAAFLLGLLDDCPKCGESFLDRDVLDRDDDSPRAAHFGGCLDAGKHAKHAAAVKAKAAKAETKATKQTMQETLQLKATWTALGAKEDDLHILADSTLAELAGIAADTSMPREKLEKAAKAQMKLNLVAAGPKKPLLLEGGS